MLVRIPDVLTSEQVARARRALEEAEWVDGRVTAGHQSARVKHNTQLPETHPVAEEIGDVVLTALQSRGILATTGDEPPGWLPARALDNVSVKELLDAVRGAGEDRYLSTEALPGSEAVEQLLERYEHATEVALRGVSVKDLAGTLPVPPAERG